MLHSFISRANRMLPWRRAKQHAYDFMNNPDSPWLVSFPRTGSHWLRMMLEKYTDQPMLPRSFFKHTGHHFLLAHTHDYEFCKSPSRLIYLYRDPVDTVFSQLKFHHADPFDTYQIELWSNLYQLHLKHWLKCHHPNRIVVRYEDLQTNRLETLSTVLGFLNIAVDPQQIEKASSQITRTVVANHTQHDQRVMSKEHDYSSQREAFRHRFQSVIYRNVIEAGDLQQWFDCSTAQLEAA